MNDVNKILVNTLDLPLFRRRFRRLFAFLGLITSWSPGAGTSTTVPDEYSRIFIMTHMSTRSMLGLVQLLSNIRQLCVLRISRSLRY